MVIRNDRGVGGGALRQESGRGGLSEVEVFARKLVGPYRSPPAITLAHSSSGKPYKAQRGHVSILQMSPLRPGCRAGCAQGAQLVRGQGPSRA